MQRTSVHILTALVVLGSHFAVEVGGSVLRGSTEHGQWGRLVTSKAGGEGRRAWRTVREVSKQTLGMMSESTLQAKYGAAVADMVKAVLKGKGKPTSLAKLVHSKMSVEDAVSRLDGRLPDEVAALVRLSTSDSNIAKRARTQFDEDSLQKARNILNNMILDAWAELDDVVFESKEFQERNRGTFEQVVSDISRIASSLAMLGEVRVDSNDGIAEQDRLRKETEGVIQKQTQTFEQTKRANDAEMTIRKNDLAVFDMILMMTACPDDGSAPASLLQLGDRGAVQRQHDGGKGMRLCSDANNEITIRFDDAKLQARVERMMTPSARMALRAALGQIPKRVSLFQMGAELGRNATTTTGLPTASVEATPVAEEPSPSGQARKCVDGTPNCGLLHDLMSLEWGKFRDAFDELASEMTKNQDEHDKSMENLNGQLNTMASLRTKYMEALAQAISTISSDTEESGEKEEQKRDLEEEHDAKMAKFTATIEEILFTKICAVRKVRNEIMQTSTLSPPANISDCDFTDWAAKDGVCIGVEGLAIECDDTCPQADPYKCGGLEWMKRDVIIVPNQYGMACPQLERQKKCKQIKCPVNCVMSEWSGFSKCSKECEGGVKIRTRSILTKAKNGGEACDTVQEAVGCNTESCDRDCTLDVWTDWSPCSMACGGGMTERVRKVEIPIRGQGKCPRSRSAERLAENTCNTHACVGDEVCTAKQDLVLTVDGSGSLKQSGFDVVRDFAANLTSRYASIYYGQEDMKVGVVLFGNGHLHAQPDGTTTIEDAISVQMLTSDMPLVEQTILGLAWQKGFTNMAQAFQTADVMLGQSGRADAQSAVLVISDGKYSMAFQTAEKANELKDKNVMIFLVPVTETTGTLEGETFRKFSSFPHETNYLRIPGLQALKYNLDSFAGQVIAKFCPKAVSPSSKTTQENSQEYMLIREQGIPDAACAPGSFLGHGRNVEDCRMAAIDGGVTAFSFGKASEQGGCYTLNMTVTQALWNTWQANRADIACGQGQWVANPFYDTFAILPVQYPVIEMDD